MIANSFNYDKDELLDECAKNTLAGIAAFWPKGVKYARHVKSRMYQVKRGFTRAVCELITPVFFKQSEAIAESTRLKPGDFEKRIGAAYDLRSKYVHSGMPFASHVSNSLQSEASEIALGIPYGVDREFQKILTKAPTYFGLERVVRFCLLRLMQRHGIMVQNDAPRG